MTINRTTVLLVAAIIACVFAAVAFEDAGEVVDLGGSTWLAIALAFIAGALLP